MAEKETNVCRNERYKSVFKCIATRHQNTILPNNKCLVGPNKRFNANIGVNPGGWEVATPRFWAGGRGAVGGVSEGRRGVVDESQNIIIEHFAQKVCLFSRKSETFAQCKW